MNYPMVDYTGAMGRMGQTFQRGMSGIMPAHDADVKRKREDEAYELLQEKLKNFKQLKADAITDVAASMQGEPDKKIQQVKSYIENIEDPKQLIAMGLEYKQQLDDFEQNKGTYKIRPTFGIKAETYTKQNEGFKKQAEEQKVAGMTYEASRGTPGTPEQQTTEQMSRPEPRMMMPEQTSGGVTESDIPTRERGPQGFTEETTIPAQPGVAPAQTFEETYGRVQESARERGEPIPTKKQVEEYATEPKQSDIDKQDLEKIKARRVAQSDALGWANLAARKETMEYQQTKELENNVRGDITNASYEELKRNMVGTKVKELEAEVDALRGQVDDVTNMNPEKAEADLAKKTKELEGKRIEWASAQQKLVTAENKVGVSTKALIDALEAERARSQYKKSLTKARQEPAPKTTHKNPLKSYERQ